MGAVVQHTCLWLADTNRAFHCWAWVCGELLTHTASCHRVQTVLDVQMCYLGLFTRAREDLVRRFQTVIKYISISQESPGLFKDEEFTQTSLPLSAHVKSSYF